MLLIVMYIYSYIEIAIKKIISPFEI